MEATVVILLSDKRSGSTFLERELCKHGAIQNVSYTPHSYNETHYWVMASHLLGAPRSLLSNNRPIRSYGSRRRARRLLESLLRRNVPDFPVPSNAQALVYEGWEALCDRFGQPVFLEKSPQHLHHWAALDLMVGWARKTQRRVRIIGLVRNPMAVLYSAARLFHTEPQERQYSWLNSCRNLLALRTFFAPEEFVVVRYEDILEHPVESFAELCEHIGVERDPSLGSSADRSPLSAWREDPSFGLVPDDAVLRMAAAFGYRAHELTACASAEGGGRRVQQRVARMALRRKAALYNVYKRVMK